MIDAFIHDFSFDTGEDALVPFQFYEDCNSEVPMDLTGYSFAADIKAGDGETVVGTFTFDDTDAATGLILMEMAASVTRKLAPMDYQYDVLVTDTDGKRDYWVRGTVTVGKSTTKRS